MISELQKKFALQKHAGVIGLHEINLSGPEVSSQISSEIHFESTACGARRGQTVRLTAIRARMAPVLYPSSGDQTV